MADLNAVIRQLQQQVGYAAGQARDVAGRLQAMGGDHALIRQELERQQRDLQNIAQAMQRVSASSSGSRILDPGWDTRIRYIESIPGRRIPFDFIVEIPIGNNINQLVQGTQTVSQDGPFIAVARYATFQSAAQFSFRDPTGNVANFQGRSFGRYRPIHSAWDLNDASAGVFQPTAGLAFPGTGNAIYASPSNHSSFRTMEFDGAITFLNSGSSYPRSNQGVPVPSAFYTQDINSPFQLAALDFFERGETLQWQVIPNHVNNPQAGNASGYGGPPGPFPFIGSQYDVHEGIVDPLIPASPAGTPDPETRLFDGTLIIGFHGFRIEQPPGPVAMI
jgi:hypothetical protein